MISGTIINNPYNLKLDASTQLGVWTKTTVDISSLKPFRISMSVTSNTPAIYLAVDDFTYKSGTCSGTAVTTPVPTGAPIADVKCDFESRTLCSWKSQTYQTYQTFNITSPNETPVMGSNNLFPVSDHTAMSSYGHYAYIAHTLVEQNKLVGDSSATIYNQLNPIGYRGPVCLSLWYYMRTNSFAQMNITIKDASNNVIELWSREGGQGEKWNLANFEINANGSENTIFISALVKYGIHF